jgi:hypothetical protein
VADPEARRRAYIRKAALETLADRVEHCCIAWRDFCDAGGGSGRPISDQHKTTVADITGAVARAGYAVASDRFPHGFARFLAVLAEDVLS